MEIFGYNISKKSNVSKAAGKEKMKDKAVGFVGMKQSSGVMEEEFLRELRWPDAGKVYQEMASNDAVVGACLYLVETLVRKANWTVVAASEEPADVEHAAFIESCMHDMEDQTWDEFMGEVLSMLTYGFSFHEILYKVRRGPDDKDAKFRSKYSDGKIGWQEIPVRSQASLDEWIFDETTGKVEAFKQDPGRVGGQGDAVEIPIEGNLLFRTKSNRNNPEGQSILRRAYRSWYFKRYIEELEGIGIERNLAGIPMLQPDEHTALFDPNNEEMVELLNWAQTLVDDVRQDRNHGLILPHGWSLKLIGSEGTSKAVDTDKVIHRHDARIAMTMLADVVVMGGDRTGSFALAEVKQGLFIASIQAILNNVCSMLNKKAIPALFNLNGIQLEAYPEIIAEDLETPSIKEVALLLRSMKVDVHKNKDLYNFLLNLINAPEMDEEAFAALQDIGGEGEETSGGDDGAQDAVDGAEAYQDEAEGDMKQSDMDYM